MPCWSRIDRFYVTPGIQSRGGKHEIWPTLRHIFDHAPTFLQIPFSFKKRYKHPTFNRRLIHDIEAQNRFTDAWQNAMSWPEELSKGQRVETGLEHIKKINETISQDNKKKARLLYKDQFKDLEEAEAIL